jgi:hypothetical protein
LSVSPTIIGSLVASAWIELSLHDKQLAEAQLHRVVEAERQLRQFLAGAGASPLVRPKSD